MREFEKLPCITPAPITAVLAVHDLGACLEEVVSGWVATLESLGCGYEILLVDDGSTDQTPARAEALAAKEGFVRLLRHAQHRGFGAALRTGLEAARHPLLLYCPCTPSYRPADAKELLKLIDEVHVVTGCRAGSSGRYRTSVRERVGRRLARLFFGVRLTDLGCRFLLVRRAVFARIPIQSDGPFAHVEILAKANFLGCLLTEAPVTYRPPAPGEARIEDASTGEVVADAWHVFRRPDFGPAMVPGETSPAA
jgi:glycosyltransferase involved in cell wall biosynthesis